jgi:hypothetical protein
LTLRAGLRLINVAVTLFLVRRPGADEFMRYIGPSKLGSSEAPRDVRRPSITIRNLLVGVAALGWSGLLQAAERILRINFEFLPLQRLPGAI